MSRESGAGPERNGNGGGMSGNTGRGGGGSSSSASGTRVVLPAPEGPITATCSPCATTRSRPRSAAGAPARAAGWRTVVLSS